MSIPGRSEAYRKNISIRTAEIIMSLACAVLCIFSCVFFLIDENFVGWFCVGAAVYSLITFTALKLGQLDLSRISFAVGIDVVIFVIACWFHRKSGVEYFFISAITLPLAGFEWNNKKVLVPALGSAFLMGTIGIYFKFDIPHFGTTLTEIPDFIPLISMTLVSTLEIVCFYFFMKQVNYFEAESNKYYELMTVEQQKLAMSHKMSALGEMAGGIAHELNNPLAIIMGGTALLKTFISQTPQPIEKIVNTSNKISISAERMAKIIKGLLSFSRNSEKDPFEPVNVSKLCDETLEFCSERFAKESVSLQLEVPAEIVIFARGPQISQVILNLVNNAFDAVSKNDKPWVNLRAVQENQKVRITVTDSGLGIPDEVADKMMQPFFTTKDIGKGTGLGLSISKGIVEDHGGKLFINKDCENTQFVIELNSRAA